VRLEAKYHLDPGTAHLLAEELRVTGWVLDEHAVPQGYTVSSIYLDDPAYTGYAAKLDGLARRTKVRLRYYADELGDAPLRLEHKEKDNQLSWKRVDRVSAADARRFLREGSGPVRDLLDPGAGCLAPVLCIQYDRLAFEHRLHGARLNFDRRLRWRSIDPGRPGMVSPTCFEPLGADQVILEIKVPRAAARELTDLVFRWNLHWRATSKYELCVSDMARRLLG
jgi:hypothetical protein